MTGENLDILDLARRAKELHSRNRNFQETLELIGMTSKLASLAQAVDALASLRKAGER